MMKLAKRQKVTKENKTNVLIKAKIEACKELDQRNQVKINRELLEFIVKLLELNNYYPLTEGQIKRAYHNWLNWGQVDMRTKNPRRTRSAIVRAAIKEKFRNSEEKMKLLRRIPVRKFTSKEAGTLIIEYINYDGRVCDFFLENQLNPNQFYNWIEEVSITGRLLGRKIFNFDDQRKIDLLTVIHIFRYEKGPKTKKLLKSMSEDELSQLNIIKTTLYKKL